MYQIKLTTNERIAPAFQYYASDFLSYTAFLSMEQRGILITLCSIYWVNSYLPNDLERLAKLCYTNADAFASLWHNALQDFFIEDGDRLKIPDLDAQREYQHAKRAKAQLSAQKRWSSNNADANGDANAMRSDMPTQCTSTSTSTSFREKDKSNDLSKKEKKVGCRIPDNFALSDETIDWTKSKFPNVSISLETEKFVNYWRAAASKTAVKYDWNAAWKSWMLRVEEQRGELKNGANQRTGGKYPSKRTDADVISESKEFYQNYPN